MQKSLKTPSSYRIPALIKRNTALVSLSQSFSGTGMLFAYTLGPMMVIAITGSAALSGMTVALLGLSRFFVAYPIGKITDTYGRKPGVLLGLALALVGTVMLGLSMNANSFSLLMAGMLVFGMGMSAAQQLRVAATDMFPAPLRGQALGYLALGSLVGLVLSPLMISAAESVARGTDYHPLALPWLWQPALILLGMVLIALVRPDPKEIGMNLERYYPGYVPPASKGDAEGAGFSIRGFLRDNPVRLAVASNCAVVGNMAVVMVLTSLLLQHHGHSLTAIAFSHTLHAAGMFAFTIPLGKLADRFGRNQVMLPGVAAALVGAALVTFTDLFWSITLGTFLVGLGWAAANVAATALIADRAETATRGRAIGVNDSVGAAVHVLLSILTGPLIEWGGLPAAGVVAILVSLLPLPVLMAIRLQQRAERRRSAAALADTR